VDLLLVRIKVRKKVRNMHNSKQLLEYNRAILKLDHTEMLLRLNKLVDLIKYVKDKHPDGFRSIDNAYLREIAHWDITAISRGQAKRANMLWQWYNAELQKLQNIHTASYIDI
jgi:hypothetical protein